MTREEYIKYPALSASTIKRYYTGSLSHIKASLDAGASLHERLLEVEPSKHDKESGNVYRCIMENPLSGLIYNGAKYEEPMITTLVSNAKIIPAKAMFDVANYEAGIIADVKTTKVKSIKAFSSEMIRHNNHIQAVWYCLVGGIEPSNFYYIGVSEKSRTDQGRGEDIFVARHSDEEVEIALELINRYIANNGDHITKMYDRYKKTQA
jgi:hypothetical protein